MSARSTSPLSTVQPGPTTAQIYQDANPSPKQRNYINGEVKNDAMLGAAAGGVLGLLESGDDVGNVIGGAIIGGLIGSVGTVYDARDERKDIVRNCMAGRGYRVVG